MVGSKMALVDWKNFRVGSWKTFLVDWNHQQGSKTKKKVENQPRNALVDWESSTGTPSNPWSTGRIRLGRCFA